MSELSTEKCPRCIDETLVRVIGNVLVCQGCEVMFVEEQHVNHPLPPLEVLPE